MPYRFALLIKFSRALLIAKGFSLNVVFANSPIFSILTSVREKFSIRSSTKRDGLVSSAGTSVSFSNLAKSKNSFKRRFISSTSFSRGSLCSFGNKERPSFNLVIGVLRSWLTPDKIMVLCFKCL